MKRKESAALRKARRRVEAWRKAQGGRGSRIPQAVWDAAVTAAGKEGLCRTARALQLNHQRLKQRVGGEAGGKATAQMVRRRGKSAMPMDTDVSQSTFIEVGVGRCFGAKAVVELCSHRGDRMRIDVEGAVDVALLSHTFWRGQR